MLQTQELGMHYLNMNKHTDFHGVGALRIAKPTTRFIEKSRLWQCRAGSLSLPFAFSQAVGLALPISLFLPLIHWEYLFAYDQASDVSHTTDELTSKMLGLG